MTEEEKELLQRKARAGAMAEIKRRWSERRDPGRIISSPADYSDQELMALLAEGKPEVAVRSIEDLWTSLPCQPPNVK
jgi:hypothetical protein